MSIESVISSNQHPLLSPSPPAFNLSQHQGLCQWISSSHQVAKMLELLLQLSPSNEYSGLISFRIDCFDLLVVQGTLKSILQHHSSEASILWCSAFFIVQLSHPYMTTGKTTALTRWTFVGKVMSLLFNMLSRLVITFLPRSKRLLISGCSHHLQWFWEPPKIKSDTVSTVSPSICHEVMGPDAIISITCIKSNSAWGALTPLALWQGSRLYREDFHFLCVVSTSHNDVLSGKN